MNYELIIFDADETLFDFKKSERVALEATLKDFDLNYKEEYHLNLYTEINAAVWKALEQGLITQQELNVQRFQKLLERLELSLNSREVADTYIEHLSRASFLYQESTDLIKRLNEDHRLAILSNGLAKVQDGRLRKSNISDYFETIIISEEVGLAKPDPAIFELLFRQMNFNDKSKALMVGDNLSSDIQGGINFGIDTCWFNPSKAKPVSGIKPTYEISSLEEILDPVASCNRIKKKRYFRREKGKHKKSSRDESSRKDGQNQHFSICFHGSVTMKENQLRSRNAKEKGQNVKKEGVDPESPCISIIKSCNEQRTDEET